MAKPSNKADRKAVVEQMRREQERKDRRQGMLVVGAAVLVGALIIGFAVWQYLLAESEADRDLTEIGASASEAGCQDVETSPAEGNNDHRPEGQEIEYDPTPPAAGPHWGQFLVGNQIRKLFTTEDRPPVERLVHSLEHGHTILWYDETIASDEQAMDDLEAIASTFPSNTDPEDKFIAAPWTEEDGEPLPGDAHLALTHWSMGGTNGNPDEQLGVRQYCSEVSGEAVQTFMADYPSSDSPEPRAP